MVDLLRHQFDATSNSKIWQIRVGWSEFCTSCIAQVLHILSSAHSAHEKCISSSIRHSRSSSCRACSAVSDLPLATVLYTRSLELVYNGTSYFCIVRQRPNCSGWQRADHARGGHWAVANILLGLRYIRWLTPFFLHLFFFHLHWLDRPLLRFNWSSSEFVL